jgi:hypothetical protein
VEFRVAGHQLELSVAWSALGLRSPPAQIDFKWADKANDSHSIGKLSGTGTPT